MVLLSSGIQRRLQRLKIKLNHKFVRLYDKFNEQNSATLGALPNQYRIEDHKSILPQPVWKVPLMKAFA